MSTSCEAEDVGPRPSVTPVAAYLPPARRAGASEALLAGSTFPRTALVSPAPAPQQVAAYKPPQRRSAAEQAAAAEAGRPGRPCPFPQLVPGPQLPLAPLTTVLQGTTYLLALQVGTSSTGNSSDQCSSAPAATTSAAPVAAQQHTEMPAVPVCQPQQARQLPHRAARLLLAVLKAQAVRRARLHSCQRQRQHASRAQQHCLAAAAARCPSKSAGLCRPAAKQSRCTQHQPLPRARCC